MIYENSKRKQTSIRQEMVKYAQIHGIKPAARYFGCSKNTVKKWTRCYESGGTGALTNGQKGPKNIPHKTSKEVEEHIIKCRKQAPCYGPKRLKWAFEDIQVSESAIARILRQNNLTRKRRKKYQRKQDLRMVKAAYYKGLSHHQEDVKHLYDIPHYWTQLQKMRLPCYQYTVRDTKSGMMMLGFGSEYNEQYSTIMTERYLYHLRLHGILMKEVTIQTDNGSEFGAKKRHIDQLGLRNTIEREIGAKHNFIPPGMSNANADVESVHATIEDEFFHLQTFSGRDDFWVQVQAYQYFYNLVRPNFSKQGKTPLQIVMEDRPGIDTMVAGFPVLDLDAEFRAKYRDNIEVRGGGQGLPKLPVPRTSAMEKCPFIRLNFCSARSRVVPNHL